MRRKLTPGLFHLYKAGHLPALFQVVGFAKDEFTNEAFQDMVAEIVNEKIPQAAVADVDRFRKFFVYQHGLFEQKDGYANMAAFLGKKDGEWKVCSNKLFYIAASPQFYETIFRKLASSGLTKPCSPQEGWTRVIVEKPFGKDLQTAQELDVLLGKLFREEQIYRIDHYLGKETVQNILAFRFSNSFLGPSWDGRSIERIHIALLEEGGIGERGGFYDGIGALRDVGQNHILQLLALFCMENPRTFEADQVRKKRAAVLRSLKIWKGKEVEGQTLRGQYEGYLLEKGVEQDSKTETYFRIQTRIEGKLWEGVSIILESGKAMPEDRVEVTVTFRHPMPCLCPENRHYQNVLRYRVQPKEGIRISFLVKKPGADMILEEKDFIFDYKHAFGEEQVADAYERLLLSVIRGDQTLFVSTEEIMAEWEFVDPIVRAWQENLAPLKIYKKNTMPLGE